MIDQSDGGTQEPGGPVPPYEGRTEGGEVKSDGSDYRDGARVGGATGPVESSDAEASQGPINPPGGPGGRTTGDSAGDLDDPGVGPSHESGTQRAEDVP